MNQPVDIEAVRTEALRKLGRNIVNFSKIEAGFKQLLSVSQFKGDENTIRDQFHRNQTRLRKQTLGKLVQEFNQNILVDANQPESTTDVSETEMSFLLQVSSNNSDFLKARKRALSEIVRERNKLIHHHLADLDTTSVEDYRQLISLLDEQNPRLLAQLEELEWMMELLAKSYKAVEELAKSPEFLQRLQSDQTGA